MKMKRVIEPELSEFELERLRNIERNKSLLKSLDLIDEVQKPKKPKLQKKANSEPRTSTPKKQTLPKRRSARLSGEVKSEDTIEGLADGLEVKEEEQTKTIVRGTIDAVAEPVGRKSVVLDKTLLFNSMNANAATPEQTEPADLAESEEEQYLVGKLESLTLTHSAKLVKQRITCSLWHPNPQVNILTVADKTGSLAFWDLSASEDRNDDAGENENEDGVEDKVFTFRPHSDSISAMVYHKHDSSTLFTSSYDGAIRNLNVDQGKFYETYFTLDEDDFISSIEATQNGLYFGRKSGRLCHLDVRENKVYYAKASTSKITSVKFNPENPNILVTSGLERRFKLWDIRNVDWKSESSDGDLETDDSAGLLQYFQHDKSCTSAVWSGDGKDVVSTSYDNTVKIFRNIMEMESLRATVSIARNNNTGRWVTPFRAIFSPVLQNHSAVFIANMRRPIDAYSASAGRLICQLYDDDQITAIPSVLAVKMDGQNMMLAGSNASGKSFIWTN
ncbi:hypothetical protein HK098_002210 [Nowakowskiella sp. JEL0407]|nr:hypothetical protein HK098_002210 [Nowakowskiella sp. JEL0407]